MINQSAIAIGPYPAPSFGETTGICAIVAVVDTRRVLQARETTARGVYVWGSMQNKIEGRTVGK
jgi:hypothetical protein